MKVQKAVITAAGRDQRTLPLQTLWAQDGQARSVLSILINEALDAGMEEIAVVVTPGDESRYAEGIDPGLPVRFITQERPLGYGHAVYCAHPFTGDDPFLHLVGDHLFVSQSPVGCARQLVTVAQAERCAVSAVQATRESLLPYYGTVGGRRVAGRQDLYTVERVREKPTPTQAEIDLLVPGLRAGRYLCFFGMHVFTPGVMDLLARGLDQPGFTLSAALDQLAGQEKYLALELAALRYDVGVKYGLLTAQIALALNGPDRAEVLAQMVEILAQQTQSPAQVSGRATERATERGQA
jgi:UTP--glucose-1-phosphate uridylyltransferase